MSLELDITGRDARDRLALLLGLGVPHPLRDLDLDYHEMVAQGMSPPLSVLQAQRGVTYQLCDDDGNPVTQSDPVEGASSGAPAVLQVPAVTEDIGHTVLASRRREGVVLETYLTERASFKAGINTKLTLRFDPGPGQSIAGNRITVAYGDRVTVVVEASQEGVYYRLMRDGSKEPLSPEETLGNQRELRFTTAAALKEDLVLRVKAHRQVGKLEPKFLDTWLEVAVRPNPDVAFNPAVPILDFGAATTFAVLSPQASASYRLYRRTLTTSDYLDAVAPDAVSVPTGNGRAVFIRAPERVAGGLPPLGFETVADFKAKSGPLTAATGPLNEDTLFLVLATKPNDQSLVLNAVVVVLVRPDPHPKVTSAESPIESGVEGLAIVTATQRGVRYQLVAGGSDINPPGFHFENRAIESARVGLDLTVGEWGNEPVLLPTGPLHETKAFKVRATKILTGLSVDLTGTVTIEVQPRPILPAEPDPPPLQPGAGPAEVEIQAATPPGAESPVAPKPKLKTKPKPKAEDEAPPADRPGPESSSTAPLLIATPEPAAPVGGAGYRSVRLPPAGRGLASPKPRSEAGNSTTRKPRDRASAGKQTKAPLVPAKSPARGHRAISPDESTPTAPARGQGGRQTAAAPSRAAQNPRTKKKPVKTKPKTKTKAAVTKPGPTRAGKASQPLKPKPPFSGLPGLLPPAMPGMPPKPGTPGKPPAKPGKPTKPSQPAKPTGPKGRKRALPKSGSKGR